MLDESMTEAERHGDVERLRRAYDAFRLGDLAAILEMLDPHVVLQEEPELPDGRVWHGRAGVAAYIEEITGEWSDLSLAPEEFIAARDHRFVVLGVQRGRGILSGAEVEAPFAHVYELSGGKATRITLYIDQKRALESVGLSK